jgi:hypothetical protein
MLNEMSQEEPEGATPKSQFVTNYAGGPNARCDGNGLIGTVWRGDLSGTVKGDITLTLHTAATPGAKLSVTLWPDDAGACAASGEEGPVPAAAVEVVPAPGQTATEVVFEGVNFTAARSLVLQVASAAASPGQTRVFFDSASHPSNMDFKCTPSSGKTC